MSLAVERRLAEIEEWAAKGADRRVSFYGPAAKVCGTDIPWLVARLRALLDVRDAAKRHVYTLELKKALDAFDALAEKDNPT